MQLALQFIPYVFSEVEVRPCEEYSISLFTGTCLALLFPMKGTLTLSMYGHAVLLCCSMFVATNGQMVRCPITFGHIVCIHSFTV